MKDFAATGRRSVDLGTFAVLRAVGAIVVQTDDLDVALLSEPAGMVLEAELGPLGHVKVGAVAVEPPDDGAVGAVDLVDGAGVAGGDEVVAVGILVDAVDVEVVPRVGGVVSGACLAGVDGEDGLCSLLGGFQ